MTSEGTPAQTIRIVSEIPQVTYPRPGEPENVIALTYLVDQAPPRTVFIPERELADKAFARANPPGAEVPAEMVRQADEVRREFIRKDIERRKIGPTARTLEV